MTAASGRMLGTNWRAVRQGARAAARPFTQNREELAQSCHSVSVSEAGMAVARLNGGQSLDPGGETED
jgi:hypothetical protein